MGRQLRFDLFILHTFPPPFFAPDILVFLLIFASPLSPFYCPTIRGILNKTLLTSFGFKL